MLVPQLKAGQTVIFDNATFHKSEKIKDLIEKAGCVFSNICHHYLQI